MKKASRLLNKIEKILAYISAFTIVILMILIVVDIFFRTFLNNPITGVLELTGEYLLVIIVYFALSYTQQQRDHATVNLFENKFSDNFKFILSILSNLLALFVFILLGIFNFIKGLEYFSTDIRSLGVLDYPLGPALMIISLGIFIISLRFIVDTIDLIINKQTKH